jgi:uncharacterized protein YjbJ (UPF0337 family)
LLPGLGSGWSKPRISEAFARVVKPRQGNAIMDKDRIAGSAKEIKGSVKEAIGKATGDATLRSDGQADKVEGKVQNAIGGVKDAMRDALKK